MTRARRRTKTQDLIIVDPAGNDVVAASPIRHEPAIGGALRSGTGVNGTRRDGAAGDSAVPILAVSRRPEHDLSRELRVWPQGVFVSNDQEDWTGTGFVGKLPRSHRRERTSGLHRQSAEIEGNIHRRRRDFSLRHGSHPRGSCATCSARSEGTSLARQTGPQLRDRHRSESQLAPATVAGPPLPCGNSGLAGADA